MKVRHTVIRKSKMTDTRKNHQATLDLDDPLEALDDLIEMGLVVDTGRREWSDKTRRFHVVWGLAEDCKKLN